MDQAFVPEKTSKLVIRVKIDNSSIPEVAINSEATHSKKIKISLAVLGCIGIALTYNFLKTSPEEPLFEKEVQSEEVVDTIKIPEQLTLVEEVVPNELSKLEMDSKPTLTIANVMPVREEPLTPAKPNAIANNKPQKEALTLAPEKIPSVEVLPTLVAKKHVIRSDHIARSQLTNGIKSREPIDELTDVVAAKKEGLRRIYFFTELRGLKGQVVRHQWIHGKKVESELSFKVGGNRWRVNSSKRLNPAAMGDWHIKVLNNKNEILVSRDFSYQLP